VLAIEMITAARALDCLRPLRSGDAIERVRERLREFAPEWREDQPFYRQIRGVAEWIESGGPLT
jgi:histidine ammonia-lyase